MWTKNSMPLLHGKTAMVTGANTGIGFETAIALYEKGAHVILACRSIDNARQAAATIQAKGGAGTLEMGVLNLASLADIKAFAEQFAATHTTLDILINNAGVMVPPASKTADGFELQFGVNHIGHFALVGALYPLLKATPGARVVAVSSMAYLRGSIDFDNLHSEQSYDAMREYCQSKLANILFSLQLQRRIAKAGDNVISVAAQPGANKTELARHMSEEAYNTAVQRTGELMDPWQGALPSIYAATMNDVKGSELYSPDQDGGYRGYPVRFDIAPHALDEQLAEKLWQYSEEVTGVKFP